MITRKAYAKVNIGLDVVGKRPDGYHEVRMIMQTVSIHDTLAFEKAGRDVTLTIDGCDLPTDDNNLIVKAAKLFMNTYGIEEGVRISLAKRIPVAAGMAGGSTDAAAVFLGLRDLFSVKVTDEELMKLSVKIGADVPYCIMGGTALAEGIGEKLTRLKDIPEAWLLIAKPDIDVSTAFVYGNLKLNTVSKHPDIDTQLKAIEGSDIYTLCGKMGNVLETVTVPAYPVIDTIKQYMKEAGALNALMSGSGPTVFGVFDDCNKRDRAYEMLKDKGYAKTVLKAVFV